MKIKNSKGFTLIELLIVVAIIAILAAIAIPQFSSYRVRGFNSSATADIRNGRTAEEAFFSDWQVYASSAGAVVSPGAAGSTPGAGIVMLSNYMTTIAANSITATAPSAATQFSTGVSQGVRLVANTTAATASTYTLITKNDSGDRCFGVDSDTTAVYWVNGVIGSPLAAIGAGIGPLATTAQTDFPGINGAAPCNGNPAGTGQLSWVTL
jgi:type IV pilus assembly protein PilA